MSGVGQKEKLISDNRQAYKLGGDEKAPKHTVTVRMAAVPKNRPALPLKLGPKQKDIARFLKPSIYAQSDAPEIVRAAKKIVGKTTDPYKAAALIQKWVFRNVKKKFLAAMSNALGVLKKMEGDCSEHSILFVALCRAAGIPARQVAGIGYVPQMNGFGYHAWGEVYVGEWVAMDPTWGEDVADATHLKFAVGDAESLGAIAGLFGKLKLEVIEFKKK